jgi:hypothetical protein
VLAGWLALCPAGPPVFATVAAAPDPTRHTPRLGTARTTAPFGNGARTRAGTAEPDLAV